MTTGRDSAGSSHAESAAKHVDSPEKSGAGFAGTAAVVTGGSRGIGQAICLALAEAGVRRMVVHFRSNREGAERTAESIERAGCEARLIQADLAEPGDVQRLADQAFEELGSIQTWVNNAGVDVLTGPVAKLDFDAKLARLWEVDVAGTIRLSRLVVPRLASQSLARPASMVFIGWDQAIAGMEGEGGQMFGPIKAAVMGYAASLAQTVAPRVRVNTIAPGWIRTAWGESASDKWDRRAKGQSLMHRWGTPEDVARAVCFAADPDNHFFSGQTIEVNGGFQRRVQPGE